MPDEGCVAHAGQSLTRIENKNPLAIILATDGIEDPYFPIPRNLNSIFSELRLGVNEPLADFDYPEKPGPILGGQMPKENMRKWLAFEKRGENDDRTVLVVYSTNNSPS